MKWLVAFGAAGFLVSLAIHIVTFTGADVTGLVQWMFPLSLGVVIVFAPAVLYLRKAGVTRSGMWKLLARALPLWATVLLGVVFIYAVINFVVFFLGPAQKGQPTKTDGRYFFNNHGNIHETTEPEYRKYCGLNLRAFSGHWMIFYLASAMILYSTGKLAHERRESLENAGRAPEPPSAA